MVLALVFVVLVPAPLGAYAVYLRVQYAGEPSAEARTRNNDALWLGHAWVDGRKTEADVTALAKQLQGTGIRDLYVHAGPLEHDGTLPVASVSPRARWFTTAMRDAAPAVAVLDQTHVLTAARGVPLSVAAAQIDPLFDINALPLLLTGEGKWWSQDYFAEVARRVEQIAVMSYDTAMPLQSFYGGYVAQQTRLALDATPASADLLMGLPAYWESNPSHWGHAETVAAAVRGARLGLGGSTRKNFGLALYVDFTATPENWAAYRDGWCIAP
jgi:hypothetical protein